MRPLLRYAAFYAVIELAAVALLVWAVGLGWALVVLAATFMVGVLLSAAQVKGQVSALRSPRTPQSAVTDGALVGLGSFLVFLPGLISTAVGALILAPPTRSMVRPLAQGMLARRIAAVSGSGATRRIDYIDGEVIDDAVPLTQ